MIADIAAGESATAELLFIVAAVLFVVAAGLAWRGGRALWTVLSGLGLACLSVGLLVL